MQRMLVFPQTARWTKVRRYYGLLSTLLLISLMSIPARAQLYFDLQSARTAGARNLEVTPGYSAIFFRSEGDSEFLYNQIGVQAAYGISNFVDMRFSYERLFAYNWTSGGLNFISFGPKIRLVRDRIAFFMNLATGFGNEVETKDFWLMYPTLLFTLPLSQYVELNPSVRGLFFFDKYSDTLLSASLGLGISPNLDKWVLRPEIGILANPGDPGSALQVGLGVTWYLNQRNK
jgi:hypothetical protein